MQGVHEDTVRRGYLCGIPSRNTGGDAYKDDETIKQFAHAEEVLTAAADIGTAFGYEHGPNVQAGIMQNNHVIEEMFQDIITNGTDVRTAAKAAQDKLNALFETAE